MQFLPYCCKKYSSFSLLPKSDIKEVQVARSSEEAEFQHTRIWGAGEGTERKAPRKERLISGLAKRQRNMDDSSIQFGS